MDLDLGEVIVLENGRTCIYSPLWPILCILTATLSCFCTSFGLNLLKTTLERDEVYTIIFKVSFKFYSNCMSYRIVSIFL